MKNIEKIIGQKIGQKSCVKIIYLKNWTDICMILGKWIGQKNCQNSKQKRRQKIWLKSGKIFEKSGQTNGEKLGQKIVKIIGKIVGKKLCKNWAHDQNWCKCKIL